VDGDPLVDIRVLEKVEFVMQGGRVVKEDGKSL
jgi:imidazolonepropionase-like amidohydrolase